MDCMYMYEWVKSRQRAIFRIMNAGTLRNDNIMLNLNNWYDIITFFEKYLKLVLVRLDHNTDRLEFNEIYNFKFIVCVRPV